MNMLEEKLETLTLEQLTLARVLGDYIRIRNIAESTANLYLRTFGYCFPDWLDCSIASITKTSIMSRFKILSITTPAQTTRTFRVLSALFVFATKFYEDDQGHPLYTARNPVEILSATRAWHKAERRTRRILPEEMPAVWKAICVHTLPHERDLTLFLMFTGLRYSEGATLTWANVSWKDKALINVPIKQGRLHSMPLPDFIVGMLRRRYNRGDKFTDDRWTVKQPTDFVFASSTGRPCRKTSTFYRQIETATGVKFSFHDLRRGMVSTGLALKIPEIELKMLIGHSYKQNMTARYGVLTFDELRPAIEKIAQELLRQARAVPAIERAAQ
ncbi:MAG: tyrosine-type recombinase/integrase [Cyanobacteria bacterium SZAS LIN-3]|nr:tyrosine-type recombinase/integrase [Cyanobacteria bacterium SZAS LIN-3]